MARIVKSRGLLLLAGLILVVTMVYARACGTT